MKKFNVLFLSLVLMGISNSAISGGNGNGSCTQAEVAICGIFHHYKQVKGKDYCVSKFTGKKGKYTIPTGHPDYLGGPENFRWLLQIDFYGTRDYWCK